LQGRMKHDSTAAQQTVAAFRRRGYKIYVTPTD